MKIKVFGIAILIILLNVTMLYAEQGKSVSFIVTGNVRAEFNLCG